MLRRIQNWANRNEGLIALVGVVIGLAGLLLPGLAQALPPTIAPALMHFITRFEGVIVWVGVVLLVWAFASGYRSHRRRLTKLEEKVRVLENLPGTLLDETASADLSNWSFGSGQWTSDQDGLSVTRSSWGGIGKIGVTWENYEFGFEFKIMHQCAGWIVRAKSDSHYVMIQCNSKQVRPHILREVLSKDGKPERGFGLIKEVDHNLALKEWNKARTEVKGHSVKVWINETLVWLDSELLRDFEMGTVGFRCSGNEHAIFRCIRVVRR